MECTAYGLKSSITCRLFHSVNIYNEDKYDPSSHLLTVVRVYVYCERHGIYCWDLMHHLGYNFYTIFYSILPLG